MRNCSFKGCENQALALSDSCWDHMGNKEDYRAALTAAIARGEDLSGANLKKAVLTQACLENANLKNANLSQADLTGSKLFDSKLTGADLVGANLSNCDLTNCDLRGSDLTKAVFTNSRLWNALLENSNLTECDLSGADLWNAKLYGAKLWHTLFAGCKSLTRKGFSRSHSLFDNPSLNEAGLLSAEESYRDLKKYFISNGMYNDASWASFKEKTMERLILKKKKDLNYLPSAAMNILCGYGEKPYRIILTALGTILLYALIYLSLNSIEGPTYPNYALRWSDYVYYSTITFTTVGYGDFIPRPVTAFRLLAASEAFMGVFLTGLFIFTLARKYSAR